MTTAENEPTKSNALWSTGNRLEVLTYLFIIFWATVLLLEVRGWQSTADWLFPAILGPLLILLSAWRLLSLKYPWLTEKLVGSKEGDVLTAATENVTAEKLEQQSDDSESPSRDLRSDAIAISWVVVFPVLAYYLGFVTVIPLFLFTFFLYYVGDVKTSIALSAIISGAIYLLFTVVLDSNLWGGLLF